MTLWSGLADRSGGGREAYPPLVGGCLGVFNFRLRGLRNCAVVPRR